MSTLTFAEDHARRIAALEPRLKAVGSNITQACTNTGIARATYERWCRRPPQSISKLDELEAEVARLERVAKATAEAVSSQEGSE